MLLVLGSSWGLIADRRGTDRASGIVFCFGAGVGASEYVCGASDIISAASSSVLEFHELLPWRAADLALAA